MKKNQKHAVAAHSKERTKHGKPQSQSSTSSAAPAPTPTPSVDPGQRAPEKSQKENGCGANSCNTATPQSDAALEPFDADDEMDEGLDGEVDPDELG